MKQDCLVRILCGRPSHYFTRHIIGILLWKFSKISDKVISDGEYTPGLTRENFVWKALSLFHRTYHWQTSMEILENQR